MQIGSIWHSKTEILFLKEIKLDISCSSSANQMIHMKPYFPWKIKNQIFQSAIYFSYIIGTLTVNP